MAVLLLRHVGIDFEAYVIVKRGFALVFVCVESLFLVAIIFCGLYLYSFVFLCFTQCSTIFELLFGI